MRLFINILLAVSPVLIMVVIAIIAYFVVRRKNRLKKLKWQIEEMFERGPGL
ncbi:hypothetical protein ACFL4J_01035 [Candidatus Margulisiibacteriota bacterium]